MPTPYPLIEDFTARDSGEISTSPYWVLAVVPLDVPLSFSRVHMTSVTDQAWRGARARGGQVMVVTDCLSMRIEKSKGSPTKSLSAVLSGSGPNYSAEVTTGDWVLAWIVNDEETGRTLVRRIRDGKQCNLFDDGLKFVGKVDSCRRRRSRGPDGRLSVRHTLTAHAFSEFATFVYYDPAFATVSVKAAGSWLARLSLNARDLYNINGNRNTFEDNAHRIIISFVNILLGRGLPKTFADPAGNLPFKPAAGGGAGSPDEAPSALLVPAEVGKLLGKTGEDASKRGGALSYADILEMLVGVQSYENNASASAPEKKHLRFVPYIDLQDELSTPKHKYTGKPPMGSFFPVPLAFANKPVWSFLKEFENPIVNELYTCLRTNEKGEVVPTLVFRQIPFSTDAIVERLRVIREDQQEGEDENRRIDEKITSTEEGTQNNPDVVARIEYRQRQQARTHDFAVWKKMREDGVLWPEPPAPEAPPRDLHDVTRFLEVPRWQLHEALVIEEDLGRSDAYRTNFVRVVGNAESVAKNPFHETQQLTRNPPIRDDFDIQRAGLRPINAQVDCFVDGTVGKSPGAMMALVADFHMGGHLFWNGTLVTLGIQAPICEGDNVEWGDMVLHVNGITESCQVMPDGKRRFRTILNVVHGMRKDGEQGHSTIPLSLLDPEEAVFMMDPDDNNWINPGFSGEEEQAAGTGGG